VWKGVLSRLKGELCNRRVGDERLGTFSAGGEGGKLSSRAYGRKRLTAKGKVTKDLDDLKTGGGELGSLQ